jgi:hypothetical protein
MAVATTIAATITTVDDVPAATITTTIDDVPAATITSTIDDVPAATITSTTTIDEASLPKQTYIK